MVQVNGLRSDGFVVAMGQLEEQCAYRTSCESCRIATIRAVGQDWGNGTGITRWDNGTGHTNDHDTYFWSEGHQCRRCPLGQEPNADRSGCDMCLDMYSPVGGQCLQCAAGRGPVTETGAASCVDCSEVGDSMVSLNGSTCASCHQGFQPNVLLDTVRGTVRPHN